MVRQASCWSAAMVEKAVGPTRKADGLKNGFRARLYALDDGKPDGEAGSWLSRENNFAVTCHLLIFAALSFAHENSDVVVYRHDYATYDGH